MKKIYPQITQIPQITKLEVSVLSLRNPRNLRMNLSPERMILSLNDENHPKV